MMNKKISISDAELEVLKELWQESPLTARQLTDRVMQHTDWSEPTIKTLLRRLLQKNAVERRQEENIFIYSALVSCEQYRYLAGRSLLNRLFNGMTSDFVTCLVRNEKLSDDEIESLKKLLEKASAEK